MRVCTAVNIEIMTHTHDIIQYYYVYNRCLYIKYCSNTHVIYSDSRMAA